MKQFRGLECVLSTNEIEPAKWLKGLPLENYQIFMQGILIKRFDCERPPSKIVTLPELEKINDTYGILELSLLLFPRGIMFETVQNYSEFLSSTCVCALMYYDYGWLEIYVKSSEWLKILEENLQETQPEMLLRKTDENDGRFYFL